jgi:transcriptional/translational regulatory protein YebC/TACO1
MGPPNCVAYLFSKKGTITVTDFKDEEKLMDVALGAGAEDLSPTDDGFEITTAPEAYETVKKALADAGIAVAGAELAQQPANYVTLSESDARKVLNLMEALEDHDDVQKVHSNFDISPEIMEKLSNEE